MNTEVGKKIRKFLNKNSNVCLRKLKVEEPSEVFRLSFSVCFLPFILIIPICGRYVQQKSGSLLQFVIARFA